MRCGDRGHKWKFIGRFKRILGAHVTGDDVDQWELEKLNLGPIKGYEGLWCCWDDLGRSFVFALFCWSELNRS